jgi:protein phosphatase 1 regulatory subunit 10
MNGSSSSGAQHSYSSSNNYTPSSTQQQQHRNQYQFPQHLHPSALSINPSFVHSSHFYPPQQSPPGTLSPQVLHSPSTSVIPSSKQSSAYPSLSSAPSVSQNLSPQVRREQFQSAIKPLLQAPSFTGAQAVLSLVTLISEYGSQDVDAAMRLEILTKIRDQAGNHYFRAWSENPTAIDISREWLKSAYVAKTDNSLVETIMPLLHVSLFNESSNKISVMLPFIRSSIGYL